MMLRRAQGFTLIELMIAITVAAVLMAIAAFSLIRARASANEASAIASLRTINQGQIGYNSACGRSFFAASLPILAMPPNEAAEGGYIAAELATGVIVQRAGYRFRIQVGAGGLPGGSPDCNGNETISAYYATAAPVSPGETGTRAFATNEVGTIWQRLDSIAPSQPFGPPAEVAK